MKKLIVCDGDSWTSGDIIDPDLDITHVNAKENDNYRLPKVWPHKLGKLLNIDVQNNAIAGSSNDGIVRRVTNSVLSNVDLTGDDPFGYRPEELFYIIGWSSPERKDFYYKGDWEEWETLYPAQLEQNLPKHLLEFYKTYIAYFWNEEEFLNRYVHQNLYLHNFLSNYDIDHIFFDSFYEGKNTKIYDDFELFYKIENKQDQVAKEFLRMRERHFIKKSFKGHIFEVDKDLFNEMHPSEEAHDYWAEYLQTELFND